MNPPKQICIGMRGNIICYVQLEPSRLTEHIYRLVGECAWAHQKGFDDLDNINGKIYSTECGVYNLELTGDYCCCGDLIRVEA